MTPTRLQMATERLERAARAESEARQELDRVEGQISTGAITRADLANVYERWSRAMGERLTAQAALARVQMGNAA